MATVLTEFTRQSLSAGKTRPEIIVVLKQAGWTDQHIKSALDAFADIDFPVPIPKPKPYLSAKEVFFYLVMFSALYCVSYHIGSLFFDLINMIFPDPIYNKKYAGWRTSEQDSIRWSISALVVSLPVFFLTFRSLNQAILQDPMRRNSKTRKWLTYFTLFIATMFLMGDGGSLVYNALSGELTVRFLLKIAVIAIIAGGNFLYFLSDMRREENV